MKLSISPYGGMDIDACRVDALAKIEEAVRDAHRSYVGSDLQLSIYDRKAKEADAILSGDMTETTLVGPEAAERGLQVEEMAALVAVKNARWKYASAQIERSRIRWKRAVSTCDSTSGVARALLCCLGEMKELRNTK